MSTAKVCKKKLNEEKTGVAAQSKPWKRDIIAVMLLVALGSIVFGRCVSFEYVLYDDPKIIFENSNVTAGFSLKGMWWALINPNYGLYQPLPTVIYMLEWELFGDWGGGYHLVTMFWHLICTVIVFLVLRRLLEDFVVAFTAAIFFTVHPIQAMVVNWIVARNEIMPTCFMLLSIDCYRRYVVGHSRFFYVLSPVFLLLAMLCKQTTILLPLVLLLLDYWPLGRIRITFDKPCSLLRTAALLFLDKLPWIAVSCVGVFLAFYGKEDLFKVSARNTQGFLPLENIGVACVAYVRYLFHFFCPLFHSFNYPVASQPPSIAVMLAAGGVLALITIAVLFQYRRRPYLLVGWGWFGLLLLPVSGLVTFADESIALRYMYGPALFFYVILAYALLDKGRMDIPHQTAPEGETGANDRNMSGNWKLVAGIVVVLAVLAFWQSGFWRNTEALATRAVALNPRNALAHNYLGILAENAGDMATADEHYRQSAEFAPGVPVFQYNYAGVLIREGRFEEAVDALAPFIKEQADNINFVNRYAVALHSTGRTAEARKCLEDALVLEPDNVSTLYNLALMVSRGGTREEAINHLEQVLRLKPDHEEAGKLLQSLQ